MIESPGHRGPAVATDGAGRAAFVLSLAPFAVLVLAIALQRLPDAVGWTLMAVALACTLASAVLATVYLISAPHGGKRTQATIALIIDGMLLFGFLGAGRL